MSTRTLPAVTLPALVVWQWQAVAMLAYPGVSLAGTDYRHGDRVACLPLPGDNGAPGSADLVRAAVSAGLTVRGYDSLTPYPGTLSVTLAPAPHAGIVAPWRRLSAALGPPYGHLVRP